MKILFILLTWISVLVWLLSFISATSTTYYLHNESDTQFINYKQLNTTTTDVARVKSRPVDFSTGNNIVLCWPENWTTSNFTSTTQVNGNWSFYVNYSSTANSAVGYLFAKIFKLNSTSEYSIANTSNSTNIGTQGNNQIVNWNYTLPFSDNSKILAGERIGIQLCVNITVKDNGANKNGFIYWENTTSSKVILPINTPDNIPPTWISNTVIKNQSSVSTNMFVNFSSNWTDNIKVDSFIFELNQSNTFKNSSSYSFGSTGNSGNVSSNITLISASPGISVSWRFWVNDSSNNWNNT